MKEKTFKRLLIGVTLTLVLVSIYAVTFFFQLRETRLEFEAAYRQAEEGWRLMENARAGDLAGQSQLLDMNYGTMMIQSGLLAVESAKNGPNLQADQALRRYLDLAALPISKVSHGDNVYAVYVAYSLDGAYVVSGGGNTVKVWEAQGGREIASMMTTASVSSVAFSPDGKFVAASSFHDIVRVWEIKGGREVISQQTDGGGHSVSFSPDGKLVAWDGAKSIQIWNLKSKSEFYHINCDSTSSHITFSPDGKYLLSSDCRGSAEIFDAKNGQSIIQISHYSAFDKAIFSPDGKYIATIGDEPVARVWDANSGREISYMYHDEDVNDVAFSPDGKFVVSGSMDGTARVWYASNGDEVSRMTHASSVRSVAFSPDGKYVVSGSYDGTARVWTRGGHEIARMADADISSVAFSPDGKSVASGGCELLTYYRQGQPFVCQGVAREWEISNGKQAFDFVQGSRAHINSIMHSPLDDHHVLIGNIDGSARIWDLVSGIEITRFRHGSNGDSVTAIFSPDGKYVLTSSTADKTARIWDASSGRRISKFQPTDSITSMAFSLDSKYVVSGSADGVIIIWSAKSGHELSRMNQNGSVMHAIFDPTGYYVASIDPGKGSGSGFSFSAEGVVHVWETRSGREITQIAYPSLPTAMAFSPDGKYIVFGASTDPTRNFNGVVSIRETLTGREIASFTHPSHIFSILFTSDGRYLITGSSDYYGTIVIWDMQFGTESARILSGDSASLALSPDERYLISGGRTTHVWDLQSRNEQFEVRAELADDLSFIMHSRYLWSKKEISRFTYGNAGWAKFSLDGRYILTVGCNPGDCNEQHVLSWNWRIEDLVAEVCRRLPRNFTHAEWAQYFPGQHYYVTCPQLPAEPEYLPFQTP